MSTHYFTVMQQYGIQEYTSEERYLKIPNAKSTTLVSVLPVNVGALQNIVPTDR